MYWMMVSVGGQATWCLHKQTVLCLAESKTSHTSYSPLQCFVIILWIHFSRCTKYTSRGEPMVCMLHFFFFLWDWLVFTRSRPALVFFVIIAHCPHLNRFHWSGSMISKADCFIFYWLLELASSFVWQSNQCTLLQATSVCHYPPPPSRLCQGNQKRAIISLSSVKLGYQHQHDLLVIFLYGEKTFLCFCLEADASGVFTVAQ